MTALLAQCAAHGEVTAVELCSRCGRFLCGDCLELVDEAPFCAPCSRRTPTFARTGLETAALTLALVGLLLWPLGLVVLGLTAGPLRRRAGQWSRVAWNLGVLETAFCLLAVLARVFGTR